jgi:hypothetical protein
VKRLNADKDYVDIFSNSTSYNLGQTLCQSI